MGDLRLRLPPLEDLQLHLVRSEIDSVSQVMAELSVVRGGQLRDWLPRHLRPARGRLDPRTVGPMVGALMPQWVGNDPYRDSSFHGRLTTMFDEVKQLPDTVLPVFEDNTPKGWLRAVTAPQKWSSEFAEELRYVRGLVSGIWRGADVVMRREEERIAQAQSAVAKRQLLYELWPELRIEETPADVTLVLPYRPDRSVRFDAGPALGLMPILSAVSHIRMTLDDAVYDDVGMHVLSISYQMPASGLLLSGGHPSPVVADPLSALVGGVRAQIVRMVATPASMSAIAIQLNLTPSTVTYHCKKLSDAGLVGRLRLGNVVWVHRTGRGDQLVDLMS